MPSRSSFLAAVLVLGVISGAVLAFPAHGAKKKTPKPTPTPGPLYGPPTPIPVQRAAGSCLRYEPGHFLVVAEVGEAGRAFRIDAATEITVPKLKTGTRVRILYVDAPDGPVARKVMPGPVGTSPAPK